MNSFIYLFCNCVYFSLPEIYAVLQCEGQDVRGQIIKIDGPITEFKTSAIFYRKFPKDKDIVIKVCFV